MTAGGASGVGRVVVIGVGNPYRGDDRAGPEVARRLRGLLPSGVEVLEHDGEPVGLLDAWQDARVAYVIDAVRADGAAGVIHRIEVDHDSGVTASPSSRRDSSHALGLGDAVELARILGRLPGRLVLVGIVGDRFDAGEALSEPVRQAVATVVDALVEEVAAACA